MTLLPPGVKVQLAFGYTDMRKSVDGLAMLVQGVLRQDHGYASWAEAALVRSRFGRSQR
jgi:hypothetical protein